jgi:hypothetical protein
MVAIMPPRSCGNIHRKAAISARRAVNSVLISNPQRPNVCVHPLETLLDPEVEVVHPLVGPGSRSTFMAPR